MLDDFCPRDQLARTALRARLGIGEQQIAIGMVAGVCDIKQQFEVIRDVPLHLTDLVLQVHLVGDFQPEADPYARACAEMVEAQGLGDRVLTHGFRDDVSDWLAALDIVLVASRREGLARCMIEAMACGTPVVSVDVCSAREMLQETGAGIVVGPDDWAGLSEALRALCMAPERLAAMGRAGRDAAESRFSTEKVAAVWRDLYARLGRTSLE